MVSSTYPKVSPREYSGPLALPSVSMARDPDSVLAGHRQRFKYSATTSLIELMVKLMGGQAPDLQALEPVLPLGWKSLVNQTVGGATLRRLDWDRGMFRHLLSIELGCGRPVGLVLNGGTTDPSLPGERAWAVIRINEVRPYLFADMVGKNPELGGGEGQFTGKQILRLDQMQDREVAAVLYLEVPQLRALAGKSFREGTASRWHG